MIIRFPPYADLRKGEAMATRFNFWRRLCRIVAKPSFGSSEWKPMFGLKDFKN